MNNKATSSRSGGGGWKVVDPITPSLVPTYKKALATWFTVFSGFTALLLVVGLVCGTLSAYFMVAGPIVVIGGLGLTASLKASDEIRDEVVFAWFAILCGTIDGAIGLSPYLSGTNGTFLLTAFGPWGFASYVYAHIFMGRRGVVASYVNLGMVGLMCLIGVALPAMGQHGSVAVGERITEYVNIFLSQVGAFVASSVIVELVRGVREQDLAAVRSKDAALACITQEARDPLAILEQIAGELKSGKNEQLHRAMLVELQHATTKIRWMVEGASAVGETEPGGIESVSACFDIDKTLKEVVETLSDEAESSGLTLTIDTTSPVPTIARGNSRRVKSVVVHLIDEAIKQSRDGALSIKSRCRGTTGWELRIEATVDPKIAATRELLIAHECRGMTMANELATSMGGSIKQFRSDNGAQVCSLFVPLAIEGFESRQTGVQEEQPIGKHGPRVLVVDDADNIRSTLSQMLAFHGVQVTAATDGKHAVQLMKEQTFDLVLCDLQMPHLDGYGVAEAMRTDPMLEPNRFVPLVAMSADEPDAADKRTMHMNGFMRKPFMAAVVKETLKTMTSGRIDTRANAA